MKELGPSESGGTNKHGIPFWERLGIDGDDRDLALRCIAQRIARYEIYRFSRILSHPGTTTLARVPVINRLIERRRNELQDREEGLTELEKGTAEFINSHYLTIGERKHARTIELAISDFFARTVTDHPVNPFDFKFDTSDVNLESWGNYWREQLEKVSKDTNPPA